MISPAEYKKCLDYFKKINDILKKIGFDEILKEVSFRSSGKYILFIKKTNDDLVCKAVVPNCKSNLGSAILTFVFPPAIKELFIHAVAGNINACIDGVEFFRFLKNFNKNIKFFSIELDGIYISDDSVEKLKFEYSKYPSDKFIKKGVYNSDKYELLERISLDYEFLNEKNEDDESSSFLDYIIVDDTSIEKVSFETALSKSINHIVTFSPKIFPKLNKSDEINLQIHEFINHPVNNLRLASFRVNNKLFKLDYSFIIIDR